MNNLMAIVVVVDFICLQQAAGSVRFSGQGTMIGVPTGIRTPVAAVKGRCPRPLDDGDPD